MARHYSYRVDHDLGFAPRIKYGICTVCGCKATTIERWAEPGSWVVGIGGNGTGKSNALIYAMRVAETPSFSSLLKTHPSRASYLKGHGILPEAPVLVSKHFYYFGDHAQPLPPELLHIIHPTQGCRRLSEQDIALLQSLLLNKFECGVHGRPNGGLPVNRCRTC